MKKDTSSATATPVTAILPYIYISLSPFVCILLSILLIFYLFFSVSNVGIVISVFFIYFLSCLIVKVIYSRFDETGFIRLHDLIESAVLQPERGKQLMQLTRIGPDEYHEINRQFFADNRREFLSSKGDNIRICHFSELDSAYPLILLKQEINDCVQKNDFNKAVLLLKKIVSTNPYDCDAVRMLAGLFLEQKKYIAAIYFCKNFLGVSSDDRIKEMLTQAEAQNKKEVSLCS